jgi:hypothetical protein
MEIKELVNYYINDSSQTLDVTFRTLNDSFDVVRNDQIMLDDAESFGLMFNNDFSESYDDDDDDYMENMIRNYEAQLDIDEDEIITFLNEYYIVNPNKLPKTELF